MQLLKKFYGVDPADKNEAGSAARKSNPDKDSTKNDPDARKGSAEDAANTNEEKPRSALQQWANDNARDIEEDDSTPLRSGL
jgi:hypothetical protein